MRSNKEEEGLRTEEGESDGVEDASAADRWCEVEAYTAAPALP